jgi:predicted NBD/HSP70 family sugar kinase
VTRRFPSQSSPRLSSLSPLADRGGPRESIRAQRRIVREEAALIAKALTSIIAVIDPELIVLGGGIGRAPGFASEVGAALGMLAPVVPEIRVSALGDDAVVVGCLAAGLELAWQRVLERA